MHPLTPMHMLVTVIASVFFCDIGGARLFASGHDRRLGGKGRECKPRWDFAGGSLKFSTDNPAVRTSFDKKMSI